MKNYAVLEEYKRDIERYMKVRIDEAFNKGYDQGYNDCKVELTEEEAKAHYNEGYKDGTKAKDGERGSIYYGGYGDGLKDGYEKGLQHGQELRIKEAECAEACGMNRAWKVARKLRHMEYSVLYKVFADDDIVISGIRVKGLEAVFEKYSASEAVEKVETWEKKQEQTKKNCKNCAHRISEKSNEEFFKCDAKGNCVNHEQWTPKQEQTEKNCDTCEHGEAYKQGSDITTMDDECGGCCIEEI